MCVIYYLPMQSSAVAQDDIGYCTISIHIIIMLSLGRFIVYYIHSHAYWST